MLFFLPGPNCPEVWLQFSAGFLVDVGNPKAPLSQKHESLSLHQCLLLVRFVGFQITQTTNCLENSRFFWKKHDKPKRITMFAGIISTLTAFFVPSWYGFQKCHPQQWWSPLSSVVMTLQTNGRKTTSLVGLTLGHCFFFLGGVLPKSWKTPVDTCSVKQRFPLHRNESIEPGKNTGWLGYIGDGNTTQLYRDYNKP